ncbi:type II secretion system F family protein [Polynucleobacter arcticus]|uniref:Type II secretion system protein GspF domain-containing protein n=1 Tax=Polynucleobacter arcticus TaxID=1743165 RepID=A0A6M9PMT3_9BURK|nr:type II secretion system F family protein [Polynucleobacter arcticus]QKM60087.1 hypothetical protein DN92_03000 [Polynucleobacter arcticus]
MNYYYTSLLILCVFSLVLSYWAFRTFIVKDGSTNKKLESRLNRLVNDSQELKTINSIFKYRVFSKDEKIDQTLKKFLVFRTLDGMIFRSGFKFNVHDLVLTLLIIFIVSFLLFYIVTGSLFQGLIIGLLASSAPIFFIRIKNAKHRAKIEDQLPGAIEYIARSLSAGHSLNAAIQAAVADSPMPIAAQLKITFDQLNIGMPIRDVMQNLIYRIDTEDVRFFAIAIVINQETGGSLASLLSEVSRMMRARLESKVLVKTLASEGKMAAKVLGSLPLIMVSLVSFINPQYYDGLLENPNGMSIIYYTIGQVMLGFIWMRQITNIRI